MSAQPSGEVSIRTEGDIVTTRRLVRDTATHLGFTQTDTARMVTAASELARHVFRYAGEGVMRWKSVEKTGRIAIELQFADSGPGIQDIGLALTEGYSTGGGLGMGLPGSKRLADEFEIESVVGEGTTITLRKWRSN